VRYAINAAPKLCPVRRGSGHDVELVTTEVEEVVVDHREPRLPCGLHDQAGADVIAIDDHRVAAGEPGDRPVRAVTNRGDDVVRAAPEGGPRLIASSVLSTYASASSRTDSFGREHDDGLRRR
jgi:hypothetical protein